MADRAAGSTIATRATPGIVHVPVEQYHADELTERPSLSASLAHVLCTRSPRHAWAKHPRLNPAFEREERATFDVGTASHAALLEGLDIVVPVEAPDWRTKEAKLARDAIREGGKIPLLQKDAEKVVAMINAVHDQLAGHHADPPLFRDGQAEQTLVWEEPGGVICRARLDWLRDDHTAVDDLKTTTRSAAPAAFARRIFDLGGDVQAAMYIRGVERLTGTTPEFRWAVVETHPPYALSVVAPDPAVLTIGRKKVEYALGLWRRCLERDEWPAYPTEVAYAELPAFEEARWLEKEVKEAA